MYIDGKKIDLQIGDEISFTPKENESIDVRIWRGGIAMTFSPSATSVVMAAVHCTQGIKHIANLVAQSHGYAVEEKFSTKRFTVFSLVAVE